MATSSFSKNFTLDSEQAVESFANIIENPSVGVPVNKSLASAEREAQGEGKLKRMLARTLKNNN